MKKVYASISEVFRGNSITSNAPFFVKDNKMISLNEEQKDGINLVEIHTQYSSRDYMAINIAEVSDDTKVCHIETKLSNRQLIEIGFAVRSVNVYLDNNLTVDEVIMVSECMDKDFPRYETIEQKNGYKNIIENMIRYIDVDSARYIAKDEKLLKLFEEYKEPQVA